MKILKLDPKAAGFAEAAAQANTRRGPWVVTPDDHGLTPPLLVEEFSDPKAALAAGCPMPIVRDSFA